ncbi:hypothetical protein M9H77_08861 [Catharanthus roseus]|uniref:Uncharacterized protein n=1 Tax=Catharanthus roseus TaxID=4058 RepID=A0ACC0BZ08_CATRO|nr:hypothetical protein M9H77_08861 [Catharanthus roseus]
MNSFEESLEENAGFEVDEDPNTFEEFLELEEFIDLGHLFTADRIFSSKDELVHWAKQTAMNVKIYLIIARYQRSRTADRRSYVTLACERGCSVKKYKKAIVDNEEEEIPRKRRGSYGTKKCECPFKLKGEQIATSESWQLFVHKGKHNHKVVVYNHGHAQAARLTEEQLQQTKQFRKSHVPPHNILRFLREQDVGCAVTAQKIYNVVMNIKSNRMQGRNIVEEVFCLSAQRGYTVFYRKREESNVLSDIVITHPTLIAMIRTWQYVLIIDTTHKTNKYNMPQLEAVGMTPTRKNFTVATAFMCNEQATTYRWASYVHKEQKIKHHTQHENTHAYCMKNPEGRHQASDQKTQTLSASLTNKLQYRLLGGRSIWYARSYSENISIWFIGHRGVRQIGLEERSRSKRYGQWLNRRPEFTCTVMESRCKRCRSSREVRGIMSPPRTSRRSCDSTPLNSTYPVRDKTKIIISSTAAKSKHLLLIQTR